MNQGDYERFVEAFDRLAKSFQKRFEGGGREERVKDRIATQMVYFRALQEYPIEAVEAAEYALSTQGSTDNWFPRAPEWGQLALEYQVAQFKATPRKLLKLTDQERDAQLGPVREARDRFVAEAREKGWEGVATFFEQLPVNHPSEDKDAPECLMCCDTGRVPIESDVDQPSSRECECIPTNTALRQRELESRKTGMLTRRRRLAASLNPAKERQLISG